MCVQSVKALGRVGPDWQVKRSEPIDTKVDSTLRARSVTLAGVGKVFNGVMARRVLVTGVAGRVNLGPTEPPVCSIPLNVSRFVALKH